MFLALLLVVGALVNGLWSCLIWGRLYWSTDYVFDFSPFWPITQSVIDAQFGNLRGALFGVTIRELQAVWLLFALVAWGATVGLCRLCGRSRLAARAVLLALGLMVLGLGISLAVVVFLTPFAKSLFMHTSTWVFIGIGGVLVGSPSLAARLKAVMEPPTDRPPDTGPSPSQKP